jgi:putative transcriptional regulator
MRSTLARRLAWFVAMAVVGIVTPAMAGSSHVPGRVERLAARGTTPAVGKFLVARREMPDPNFAKSVVLLLEYGEGGALGLIINRPSKVELSTLSDDFEGLASSTDPIYFGGPVPAESLFVIFRAAMAPEGSESVFGKVRVTRSAAVLRDLIDADPPEEFRVFFGYAGWAPGQLDNEVSRGDWHVVDSDEESVFAARPAEVWDFLVPPEPTRQVRLARPSLFLAHSGDSQ